MIFIVVDVVLSIPDPHVSEHDEQMNQCIIIVEGTLLYIINSEDRVTVCRNKVRVESCQ